MSRPVLNIKGRRGRKRLIPEWARDETLFNSLVHRVFPNQSEAAKRWRLVRHHYYLADESEADIAYVLQISVTAVRSIIRCMKRAATGRWCNGQGMSGIRRRGGLTNAERQVRRAQNQPVE